MSRLIFKADELKDNNKIVYFSPGHAPSIVSTIGPKGNVNLATFEQTMMVSYHPPRILLAITENSHTYKNILDSKECVVGFPRSESIQSAYDAGIKIPRDASELDYIKDLSMYPSQTVNAPSIDQCWINMECKLYSITSGGDHQLVILDVLSLSLDKKVYKADKVALRNNLPAVYYTTSGWFFELGSAHHVNLSEDLQNLESAD